MPASGPRKPAQAGPLARRLYACLREKTLRAIPNPFVSSAVATRRATTATRSTARHLLAVFALTFLATPLAAQTIAVERRALAQAQRDEAAAIARAARYDRAAARATGAAERARRAQVATAARIQSAEARIAAADARLALIERLRGRVRARLAAMRAPIVRLAAALRTLARRPALLALVQPGSIDDLVHVRALLAASVPAIRARSAGIRRELAEAERLREAARRTVALRIAARGRLHAERLALARTETAQRRRSAGLGDAAMFEQDRALALGERARDIVTLMDRIDAQAGRGARLASLPGPIPRPILPGLAPPPRPAGDGRITSGPPVYRLPVIGRVTAGLGEISDAGVRARGLTLTTAPSAQVVAPAGGRIVFAGPFRGYGAIVIVDHGDGWTTLLTGLARAAVAVGDKVEGGSPLGLAPAVRPAITVELRHGGQPVDIPPILRG
jgi:septal ring factor EnvC (AmiA/AmiB activator)